MGDIYLTDLANVLRAARLQVIELEGWERRARGSGGYNAGRPWCVMWHHTASSGGDGSNDAAYCTFGDEDAPLTNLVVGNTGVVYVCAAGCTNTNGKGNATTVSRGTVPADSMNTYAVGIEISNNGVGGPYPQSQIDACFAASLAITKAYGLEPDDVCTHQHYAPDRKVDPATATAVAGPWKPGSCTSSGSWDVDDLRAECRNRAGAPTSPAPAGEDEVVILSEGETMYITKDPDTTYYMGNGLAYRRLTSDSEIDRHIANHAEAGDHLVDWKTGNRVTKRGDVQTASGSLKYLGRRCDV